MKSVFDNTFCKGGGIGSHDIDIILKRGMHNYKGEGGSKILEKVIT